MKEINLIWGVILKVVIIVSLAVLVAVFVWVSLQFAFLTPEEEHNTLIMIGNNTNITSHKIVNFTLDCTSIDDVVVSCVSNKYWGVNR